MILQGEVELFFLVEVETQDGVEAVEDATKIGEIFGLGTSGGKVDELSLKHVDQVEDLAMGPAHQRHRILPG